MSTRWVLSAAQAASSGGAAGVAAAAAVRLPTKPHKRHCVNQRQVKFNFRQAAQRYSTTCTPFQKAILPLMLAAASVGSG
jgi:hypothetical protein